jgi:hypothetical protein
MLRHDFEVQIYRIITALTKNPCHHPISQTLATSSISQRKVNQLLGVVMLRIRKNLLRVALFYNFSLLQNQNPIAYIVNYTQVVRNK